jgi:hypothetical protein
MVGYCMYVCMYVCMYRVQKKKKYHGRHLFLIITFVGGHSVELLEDLASADVFMSHLTTDCCLRAADFPREQKQI